MVITFVQTSIEKQNLIVIKKYINPLATIIMISDQTYSKCNNYLLYFTFFSSFFNFQFFSFKFILRICKRNKLTGIEIIILIYYNLRSSANIANVVELVAAQLMHLAKAR